MTDIERAYAAGMAETFARSGLSKRAAHAVTGMTVGLEKKASMFNFSDNQYGGGGIHLSSLILPLLAAAAAGYVGYNSGITGSTGKSAFQNIKNYLGRGLDKIVRKNRSPSFLNIGGII
jgi:hypothetical protein